MKTVAMLLAFVLLHICAVPAIAQEDVDKYFQLDPKAYDPAVDVNMDMFMYDWHDSAPRSEHGNLVVRDIFTKHTGDDPLKPEKPGAVLNVFTEFAYATLAKETSTTPETLKGEQKIFYMLTGECSVSTGSQKADIGSPTAILIPEGLEFSITNTGDEQLTMVIIAEPTYEGFKPLKEMVIRDERALPISGTTGHWVNINKSLFTRNPGNTALLGMSPVWLDPVTMAQPHASRGLGADTLWLAIEGNIFSLIGKKLYNLKPGMAYKNPSDGKVYHANMNVTDKQIKMLWVRSYSPEQFENRKKKSEGK